MQTETLAEEALSIGAFEGSRCRKRLWSMGFEACFWGQRVGVVVVSDKKEAIGGSQSSSVNRSSDVRRVACGSQGKPAELGAHPWRRYCGKVASCPLHRSYEVSLNR